MGEETDASPFANLSTSRENQEYITSADTHKVGQELGTLDPLFANSVLSNAILVTPKSVDSLHFPSVAGKRRLSPYRRMTFQFGALLHIASNCCQFVWLFVKFSAMSPCVAQ
jgi:hypothetical protein